MNNANHRQRELQEKVEELQRRLAEAVDALCAIHAGARNAAATRPNRAPQREGSDKAYGGLLETLNEGAVAFTEDGTILFCNGRFASMVKTPAGKLVGVSLRSFIANAGWRRFEKLVQRARPERRPPVELSLRASDETRLPVRISVRDVPLGQISRTLCGVITDLTERMRAEQRLQALRLLAKQILETQEAERRRLARELHDSVNQLLTSARFRIQSITQRIAVRDRKLGNDVRRAGQLLENALQEVRRISHNLRPSELDDLGLLPAIRSACVEFQKRTGTRVELRYGRLPRRLPTELELALYRIFQEALSHVERHSHAGGIQLHLTRSGSAIRLRIQDDGKGIAAISATRRPGQKPGFGLVSMRERAAFLRGTVVVKSARGQGTEITVQIPLKSCTSLQA